MRGFIVASEGIYEQDGSLLCDSKRMKRVNNYSPNFKAHLIPNLYWLVFVILRYKGQSIAIHSNPLYNEFFI